MVRKFSLLFVSLLTAVGLLALAPAALAAGIGPSGGGSHTVGSTFSVSIVASGTTFNAFQGKITVTGPVSASVSPGSASWAPGGTPTIGGTFEGGITSPASSFTIATVSLRGTGVGSGSVSVSGVELVNNGAIVATGGGSTTFTINRAPTPPGAVTVSSPTNPDQSQSYGVTTAVFNWTAPANGATGYAAAFNQTADTTPPSTVTTTALTASYDSLSLGVYYFHIKAQNGDGWGPVTHFKLTTTQSVDSALKAPTIVKIVKLPTFKNDIKAGTVTGFALVGTSTGLTGFTVNVTITPAMPAAQLLTTLVSADGSWQLTFDQAIPTGFYKVSVMATKDKTATAASTETNFELSVANGGTAKLISNADLPQPDLTVTVAGIKFQTAAAYHHARAILIWLMLGFGVLSAGLVFLGQWLFKRFVSKRAPVSAPPVHRNSL